MSVMPWTTEGSKYCRASLHRWFPRWGNYTALGQPSWRQLITTSKTKILRRALNRNRNLYRRFYMIFLVIRFRRFVSSFFYIVFPKFIQNGPE